MGTAKYSSNNIMSLSYAAHINGDKVYDIATGYWIEAKQEAAAAAERMTWAVYLYDDTGAFVEKYAVGSFAEADKDKWLFAGFDMNITSSAASWRIFVQVLPSYSVSLLGSGTSTTLKQYFSGEQGYAINADYAVIDVQPLSVDANGTYTAPFSKAYSPVTVDVQEQPWQPLQDGYSNFWFELTNDTLSPWLNFSAKNENAVIDWGDGTGEVALDTLTPTHTYSKAGKYVVKVKGVTAISQLFPPATSVGYFKTLQNVELSNEITNVYSNGLSRCFSLKNVYFSGATSLGGGAMQYSSTVNAFNTRTNAQSSYYYCFMLESVSINSSETTVAISCFDGCSCLNNVTLPNSIESIGNRAFAYCYSLSEIHLLSTTPPTLYENVFLGMSNFIIYVPVGYGETYKSAAGWSAYADHILEEGQTPNRAMLSRLAKAVETDTDEDMR